MWQRMKMSMYRFMQGRYGFDSLSNFLLMEAFILIFLNLIISFTPLRISLISLLFSLLSWLIIVYCYIRVFSKNYAKRKAQNDRFLMRTAGIREKLKKRRALRRIRRTHHIYSCPGCSQKIKIPKGKGKIVITCPKCRMEFTKNS